MDLAQQIADSWKAKDDENYRTHSQRALRFGVSVGIVNSIDLRRNWKEVIHPNEKVDYTTLPREAKDLIMSERDWECVFTKLESVTTPDNFENKTPCWTKTLTVTEPHKISYRGRSKKAYIWAAEWTEKRFITQGESSRHLCGNNWCSNPEHLKLGNAFEQASDKRIHGTAGSKLTIEKAREIRKDERSKEELAQLYSVSTRTICSIKAGSLWKE